MRTDQRNPQGSLIRPSGQVWWMAKRIARTPGRADRRRLATPDDLSRLQTCYPGGTGSSAGVFRSRVERGLMIWGLKRVIKYALGTDVAGRNLAVYPDDTFIVSYPRSGNTWARFLIANLVHPNATVTFANIEKLIPDTSSQSNRALKRTPRPRIIKTHQYFDPRYRKVIYIVRDPRDVALSYHQFQRKYRQIEDSYPPVLRHALEARVGGIGNGGRCRHELRGTGPRQR